MALLLSIGGGSLHDDLDTDVSVLLPPETKRIVEVLDGASGTGTVASLVW
jgi:hypothetical protein